MFLNFILIMLIKNLMANRLILLRHGESLWNKENIYTGWYDIGLTEKGYHQCNLIADKLIEKKFIPNVIYTSEQKRALETSKNIKKYLKQKTEIKLPIIPKWRLNERHYGSVTGLNKSLLKKTYNEKEVNKWINTYYGLPPNLKKNHISDYVLSEIPNYSSGDYGKSLSFGESLQMVSRRMIPYYNSIILNSIKVGDNVLIVSHSNTLKVLIRYLEDINKDDINSIKVNNLEPIVYDFDKNLHPIRNLDFFN